MYNPFDGYKVVVALAAAGFIEPKLIGSLGRGNTSLHDIDILLSNYTKTDEIKRRLAIALHNKGKIEDTDWGGLYFNKTSFGTVDIFFSDKDFDY